MLEVEPSSVAVAVHTWSANWSWSDGFQFVSRLDQRKSWEGNRIFSLIHLGSFSLMNTRNSWELTLSRGVVIRKII